jgi:hypothetical protein
VRDLVTNLMHYCHRERIDWTDDIMHHAFNHFRCERLHRLVCRRKKDTESREGPWQKPASTRGADQLCVAR